MIYLGIALGATAALAVAFLVWKPYIVRTWRYLQRWYRVVRQMNQHIEW